MPAPATYTEDQLASFAVIALGPLAPLLGWTPETPQVAVAVEDAVLAYHGGAGLIANATDVPRLRALARVAIWRAVRDATAGYYRFSTDGQAFDRQQVHEQAVKMVAEAERDAGAWGAGPALVVASVERDDASDPYSARPSQWGGALA